MQEKEISKKLIFAGRLFRIWQAEIELADGSRTQREYLERIYSSVAAVLLDNDLNIYLVKEFRFAVKEVRVNLPGGRFNLGLETPEQAVVRELREEVGLRPQKIEKLFEFHGGGSWLWHQYFFFCSDPVIEPLRGDWDENIEVVKIPFKKFLRQVLEDQSGSRIIDFKAIIMVAQKLGLLEVKK